MGRDHKVVLPLRCNLYYLYASGQLLFGEVLDTAHTPASLAGTVLLVRIGVIPVRKDLDAAPSPVKGDAPMASLDKAVPPVHIGTMGTMGKQFALR